jgi:signal transduction histidine kinase
MEAVHSASQSLLAHATPAPSPQYLEMPLQTAPDLKGVREARSRSLALGRNKVRGQKDRLNGEFLATVCHELRSPIGAIQNAVKVLRRQEGKILLHDQMHDLIERQAAQMALLVDGLLDITRITRSELTLNCELVDLRTVLRNAVETLDWDLKRRDHRLSQSAPESGVWLLADAARLEQVFVNLLGNASKYTDKGGEINLSLHVSDGCAIVRIRDSGIGIASDMLPQIFNLFMQIHGAAPRSGSGLGIGLALVRALVERHRGNVAAVSAGLGQGSEFTVRLPLEEQASSDT